MEIIKKILTGYINLGTFHFQGQMFSETTSRVVEDMVALL